MSLKNDLETMQNNPRSRHPSYSSRSWKSVEATMANTKNGGKQISVTRCHKHTWPSSILCSCNAMFFSLTFRDSLGSWPTFVFGSNTRWLAASQTPLAFNIDKTHVKKINGAPQPVTSGSKWKCIQSVLICWRFLRVPSCQHVTIVTLRPDQ
jgi:hypothetical protein